MAEGFAIFKDQNEIEIMRKSAKIASSTLEMIEDFVKPGITTNELDVICHDYIVKHGAIPAPLGYKGFPKSICTSINRVACHGIPDEKKLKDGDLLNIDVSLSLNGFYSDTCKMYFVGKPNIKAKRLSECAQKALYRSIKVVRPGVSIREVGRAIQACVDEYGYATVKDFCGHGVGRHLHQEPQVLHYDDEYSDRYVFEPGMTFTIEPIINAGKQDVKILADGWTVVTKDQSLSAQYEHTIIVTDNGFEILTLRSEESLDQIMKA
jgi:methionyl aminopeptidase